MEASGGLSFFSFERRFFSIFLEMECYTFLLRPMQRHLFAFILVFQTFFCSVSAQEEVDLSLVKRYAENSFRDGDYEFALENYLKLYVLDESNIEYNLRIGICYVETNINKTEAIKYLEYVISRANFQKQAFYYLGRAYMYTYRFTEAVEAFYEYKISGINDQLMVEIDRLIEMAYFAQEKLNFPENVKFEHLDSMVNSKADDYFPFVSADGALLLFTSNRKYVKDLETNIANVYQCKSKKGLWENAVELETNTYANEEIVGMTPDALQVLIYSDGDYTNKDILLASRKGSKFSMEGKEKLPSGLNTEDTEYGASVSADGQTIYFASDRKGGRGGLDIYFCQKKIDGGWTEPENLGTAINTGYDENFPNISPDGKTLTFASKGHPGIGGYDIFESVYNDEIKSWQAPRNLGSPINTPFDNTIICYAPDKKTAFIAANRAEGFGNLDIYKISFGDESLQSAIIQGLVFVGPKGGAVPYSDDFLKVLASVYDKFGNVYARYDVDETGNFFATLPPGEYKLVVKFEGTADQYEEDIVIRPEDANEPIVKEVYLTSGQ